MKTNGKTTIDDQVIKDEDDNQKDIKKYSA